MTHNFIINLPNRGVIALSGEDRVSFLQGLVSNDVTKIAPGTAIYACLLTAQGKFLHDLFIYADNERFLIDCEAERKDDLIRRLTMFQLRSKIEIMDLTREWQIFAITEAETLPGFVFADPRHRDLGFRAISPKTVSIAANEFEIYDRLRLSLGVPDGSRDMEIEKATLFESNIDELNGISWTKGCYMGQELTARMKYRGLGKKRLMPVRLEGKPVCNGALLISEEKEIGEMRSSCGDLGLALLRLDAIKPELHLAETIFHLNPAFWHPAPHEPPPGEQ